MKVRMTKTVDGAPEGTIVHTFKQGTVHDLSHSPRQVELARVFLRECWAVEVGTAAEAAAVKAEEDRQSLFKKLDESVARELAAEKVDEERAAAEQKAAAAKAEEDAKKSRKGK